MVCGLLQGMDALVEAGVDLGGRFFLVGGGSQSAAYQRIVADLAQREVRVPAEDEVVATGAALQAAATHAGLTATRIARRWGLGAGTEIAPDTSVDSAEIRTCYAARARQA